MGPRERRKKNVRERHYRASESIIIARVCKAAKMNIAGKRNSSVFIFNT